MPALPWWAPGLLLAPLGLLPAWAGADSYIVQVVFITFLFVIQAVAWNLIGGYTGQVSFGDAAFYGIGAYTTALLLVRLHAPVLIGLPLAALVAGIYAFFIGSITLRLRGPYFSIATIAVGEATRLVALYWEGVTGGGFGLTLPLSVLENRVPMYYVALGMAGTVIALSYWVQHSRLGLALAAIRMDEDAAGTLGVNAARYKVFAFMLAASLVGVAGALFASTQFYLHPDTVFAFSVSLTMIMMALVGGIATVWGPVLGAVIFVFLREQLVATAPQFHLLLFGLLIMAVMLLEPGGLVGLGRRLPGRRVRGL